MAATPSELVELAAGEMSASEAAKEIGRLATRIVCELAPVAGLHVGITIKPAPPAPPLKAIAAQGEKS